MLQDEELTVEFNGAEIIPLLAHCKNKIDSLSRFMNPWAVIYILLQTIIEILYIYKTGTDYKIFFIQVSKNIKQINMNIFIYLFNLLYYII